MAIEGTIAVEVLTKLHEKGIMSLTVHDSYICRQSDTEIVEEVINETLAKHNLQIKLERKIIEEVKTSDLKTATIVSVDAYDPSFPNLPPYATGSNMSVFKREPAVESGLDDFDYLTADF